jgi:hypothetical protein
MCAWIGRSDSHQIDLQELGWNKPTAVGGVKSCGMVCDSPMLRWTGGAKGIVQQLPEFDETGAAQYFVGSAPPESRPRS